LERMDEITGHIGSLSNTEKECKTWATFEKNYVGSANGSILIQGDSGL
jgi:hypothetical protein